MEDKCDRIDSLVREVQFSVLDEFCQYFWLGSRFKARLCYVKI